MKTDNSSHLTAAAHQRSEDTRRRAEEALRDMDSAGDPITYAAVAAAASVSRSWLYRHPALRVEIERLRTAPGSATSRPAVERTSAASRHERVATLLDANRALRDDNQQLRAEVAVLLGERRDHVCGVPL